MTFAVFLVIESGAPTFVPLVATIIRRHISIFRDLLILFLAATLLQPPPILSSLARYLALGKSVVKRY